MDIDSIILLFDLDETITPSLKVISEEMKDSLLMCKAKGYTLGLISGSDYKKVMFQLKSEFINTFDYIFCENGTQMYRNGELVHSESIVDALPDPLINELVNYVLVYISNLNIPKKRGCFFELRKSIINISPIGRCCSDAERQEFFEMDSKEKIRQKMCDDLAERFKDTEPKIQFSIGGKISIDCFPVGWSKIYCLRFLDSFKTIHFFADMVHPGGNDYELFISPMVIPHKVVNYQDTIKQLRELFLNDQE